MPPKPPVNSQLIKRIREVTLVLSVFVTAFLGCALFTYNPSDPGWSQAVSSILVHNVTGRAGAWLADFLLYIFGLSAYLIPFFIFLGAWSNFQSKITEEAPYGIWIMRGIGALLLFTTSAALLALYIPVGLVQLPFNPGGILGYVVGSGMTKFMGMVGASITVIG